MSSTWLETGEQMLVGRNLGYGSTRLGANHVGGLITEDSPLQNELYASGRLSI